MTKIITAVYEKGALYLSKPLNLRERQTVRIQILVEDASAAEDVPEPSETLTPGAKADTEADKVKAVIQRLIAKGWIYPKPEGPIPPDPVSAEERQALADRLGRAPGKLASEMVIEDRGEW